MRATIATFLFLFAALACHAQLNPQSRKVTDTFFPDIPLESPTPAFQKKKGFTTYEEMMEFLQAQVSAHPSRISLSFIGNSQKGKQVPMLRLRNEATDGARVKVWIQGGLHGDEPASTEGVLYLVYQLLNDNSFSYLLDRIDLAVVPMANIDGYEKQERNAANGLDLNRDQTKLMAPESILLKKAFNTFQPEVAIDFHEYRPYRRDFAQLSTYGITSLFDAMFLYSGNLNVPENLRNFTQQVLVKNAADSLDAHGLKHHDYVTTIRHLGEIQFNQGSVNARSSATSFALAQTISCLVEIRGVGIGRTSFGRRVFSTYVIGLSFLRTAYDHVSQIKEELEKARQATGEAVVQSKRKVSQQALQVIDLDKNEEITLTVTIRDAWQSTPELVRERPGAYLILPSETTVVEKLTTLGLELEQLPEATSLEAGCYVVTAYQRDPEVYEGVHTQTVSTRVESRTQEFPAGTYVLYMDQPRANLAIEVLEPEAPNSFVSFEVIPTEEGAALPVYRYMNDTKF